ncbi:MAG: iron-containing alcohol dehydrogenase [Mycoplasmatales bacterium]
MNIETNQSNAYQITIINRTNYQQAETNYLTSELFKLINKRTYCLIIDENVHNLHADYLHSLTQNSAFVMTINAKEEQKSMDTTLKIIEKLNAHQINRSNLIIGIGGGIIGDIVGFASSIYMRGIPFIQIPTTLLSQVDSSIGNKVGINHLSLKNNVGSFYAPTHVFIDLHFLTTLTTRLFREGMAEIIKHGLIDDQTILNDLETVVDLTALRENDELLEKIIRKSLLVKKKFVEADPNDLGIRHVLNFGHTYAHALELTSDVHLFHGEAVIHGILIACATTDQLTLNFQKKPFKRLQNLVNKFGLLKACSTVDFKKIINDKKRSATNIKELFIADDYQITTIEIPIEKLHQHFELGFKQLVETDSLKYTPNAFHFQPTKLSGTVHVPPSKSHAHRLIIAAALSDKPTILNNVHEISYDIYVTLNAISFLGATYQVNCTQMQIIIYPNSQPKQQDQTINMEESGTSLRLLLPLMLVDNIRRTITGENKLPTRPNKIYHNLMLDQKIDFSFLETDKFLPLTLQGTLNAGEYLIDGSVSSQFISGLLFTLPLLNGESKIVIENQLESIPYVQMTLDVLQNFGIIVKYEQDYSEFIIPGNQVYTSLGSYEVEQDYSGRCFWEVANALGNQIKILPERKPTLQGDSIVGELINQKIQTLDLTDIPDSAPIMAVYYSQVLNGQLQNTERLKYKESDRLQAIIDFLSVNQIKINQDANNLSIEQGKWSGGICNTYLDHRILMALVIGSTTATGPITVSEITSSKKSYSKFIEMYLKLGGKFDEE